MPEISIIIPVYKVRDYIVRCMEGVLRQPGCSLEAVVIDDGSPDDSISVLEEYLRSTPENGGNVRIVHQENGGLSAARNTGIREAQGEYLWFVDSDDSIRPGCLAGLYRRAKDSNLDMLMFDMEDICEQGHSEKVIDRTGTDDLHGNVFTGEELFCKMREEKVYLASACCYLIRRRFLEEEGLSFMEGVLHEDELFTPGVMLRAKRAMYLPEKPYLRYVREGSITTSDNVARRMESLEKVLSKLAEEEHRISPGNDRLIRAYNANAAGLACIFFGETSKLKKIGPDLKKSIAKVRELCRKNGWKIPLDVRLYVLKNRIGVKIG